MGCVCMSVCGVWLSDGTHLLLCVVVVFAVVQHQRAAEEYVEAWWGGGLGRSPERGIAMVMSSMLN